MSDPSEPTGPATPPRRVRRPAPPTEPGSVPATPSSEGLGTSDAGHDADDIWTEPAAAPAEPVDGWDDDHDYDDYDDYDDHDYVDLPSAGSVPKWAALGGVLVLLVVLVVGGGWFWYDRQIDPPGGPGEVVTIDVPSGVSVEGIGAILEDEGVISNAWVFDFYAGRRDAGPFQAGVYEMRRNSDFDLVLDTLDAGPVEPLQAEAEVETVSVPEGFTVARIVTRIAEGVPDTSEDDLRAALESGAVETVLRPADQSSYEGLLFPATYDVTDDLTGVALLQQMADEMEGRLGRLGVEEARTRLSQEWGLELTDYDFLKVASMVQAEAGNVEEAPQIATVIYNRLAEGMPLGIDAVDRYGADLAGTAVDYNDRSAAYNTRRNPGLPPTPISAPGEFALAAALRPASGPWMYYVLESERQHAFVVTDQEFQAAKRVCIERDLGCG